MLSKKTKYAIKALMVLGRNYGKEPMQIVKIADEERRVYGVRNRGRSVRHGGMRLLPQNVR